MAVAEPAVGAPTSPDATELQVGQLDLSVWRNRDFLLLWLAQAISQTAQNAIWYGIVILVQTRSHSSTQLSLAVLTLIIPSVAFGVLAGVYVDRWDKRAVLIATNLIRGAIAFAYVAFGVQEMLPLSLLFAVNFLFSTVGQFFAPAESAMIPAIVPRSRLHAGQQLVPPDLHGVPVDRPGGARTAAGQSRRHQRAVHHHGQRHRVVRRPGVATAEPSWRRTRQACRARRRKRCAACGGTCRTSAISSCATV